MKVNKKMLYRIKFFFLGLSEEQTVVLDSIAKIAENAKPKFYAISRIANTAPSRATKLLRQLELLGLIKKCKVKSKYTFWKVTRKGKKHLWKKKYGYLKPLTKEDKKEAGIIAAHEYQESKTSK